MTDAEAPWIQRARDGDQRAFRRLVEPQLRPLFHLCFRILGDAAGAEDAVQESLLAAWRALPRFDGRAAFGTWLHRIAVNAAVAQLRSRRDFLRLDPAEEEGTGIDPAAEDPGFDPLRHAADQEFGVRLATALAGLSGLERAAFVLRHLEQYPMEEIAGALASNVNACKQAVFRAVRKLRLALEPLRSEA